MERHGESSKPAMIRSAHTEIFVDYFQRQFWGNKTGSSGPNSDPHLTTVLRRNLRELLEEWKITSLLDAGCGDANLFRALVKEENFQNRALTYMGYECVPDLTLSNTAFFRDQNKGFNPSFKTVDVVTEPLPKVDLILCRDVVHYLPNSFIAKFLENCRRSGSKYLLVTHNIYSESSANSETDVGVFRPVNLTQKPFGWTAPAFTMDEDVFGKQLALFELERPFHD